MWINWRVRKSWLFISDPLKTQPHLQDVFPFYLHNGSALLDLLFCFLAGMDAPVAPGVMDGSPFTGALQLNDKTLLTASRAAEPKALRHSCSGRAPRQQTESSGYKLVRSGVHVRAIEQPPAI